MVTGGPPGFRTAPGRRGKTGTRFPCSTRTDRSRHRHGDRQRRWRARGPTRQWLARNARTGVRIELRLLAVSMLAGGDLIEDTGVVCGGATSELLDVTRAPSTIGTRLRAFRW